MKETEIHPVHAANLVANSGNIAYGVELIHKCLMSWWFKIQIFKNTSFDFSWKIIIRSGHNFAHGMTAELSWRANSRPDSIIRIKISTKINLVWYQLKAHKLFVKFASGFLS